MPIITRESTAVVTEHLGWTPLTLVDDIINSLGELMYGGVESLENMLMSFPPEVLGFKTPAGTIRDTDDSGAPEWTEDEANEIQKGITQLETLWENAIDSNFDKFEIFVMRNIMAIEPELVPWVRLEHHKDLDFGSLPAAPTSDSMEIDSAQPPVLAAEFRNSLRELRQTFLATLQVNLQLRAEKSRNAKMISDLETLVSSLSPSYQGPPTVFSPLAGASDIKDNALFVASQMGSLTSRVAAVKPKYTALLESEAKVAASGTAGTSGADAERQLHIERWTKRHLQLKRGLKFNDYGEVLGGGFEGGIRKDVEEVKRLEEAAVDFQRASR